MRPKSVLILAVFVLICAAGATGVAADDDVTLTVTVVDQNGDAVGQGVTVEATWEDGDTAGSTASNGKVFIDVPEGADVELDVDDDQYVRNRPLVVEDADDGDVELQVFPHGTAIVSVIDTDGEPLSGATVLVRQGAQTISSGQTDGTGVFRSDIVEQGEYSVWAVKPGFIRISERITVDAETETELTLTASRVSLDVTVFDDHFEEPQKLTNARVLVESDIFDANVSASDGSTSLNVPVNTRYRIVAVKSGYTGETIAVHVRETPHTVNATAQRNPELKLGVSNRRVVIGETTRVEVTNAYDEPVSGVTVRVDGERVGETDDRGERSVRIDSVGEHTIDATDGTIDSETVTVTGFDPDADTGADTQPTEPNETDDDSPGFGVVVTLVAISAVLVVRVLGNRYG